MDQKQVKEILGKQLQLLAEVSEGKPENLAELSAAMCEIADRLVEVRDPICNDREVMSETIRGIFEEELKASSTRQKTVPRSGFQQPHQPSGP